VTNQKMANVAKCVFSSWAAQLKNSQNSNFSKLAMQ